MFDRQSMFQNNMMNYNMLTSNFPNFGLGPNDSMSMFNSMLNNFNNNPFMNPLSSFGQFPGPRMPTPSPFIFQDNERNNVNNDINNINNIIINNNSLGNERNDDSAENEIRRDENFNVQRDMDELLKNREKLEEKNKDIQYILNYIPFTTITDAPKEKENQCLICLYNFEVDEKVSALPCFHCFHTKCIDGWIVRNRICPICKFEVTLKSLIGEDIIKQLIETSEENKEEEATELRERREQENSEEEEGSLENERIEREENEKLENERRERERVEQEILESERLEIEEQERLEIEIEEQERLEKEIEEQERLEKEKKEKERLEQEIEEQERLEKEKKEQERLEKEKKEKERLEKERLENLRKEKERLEQEKSKKEGKESSMKIRIEKEKNKKLEIMRKEKERIELFEKIRKQNEIRDYTTIQRERIKKAKEILKREIDEYEQEENDKKKIHSRRINYSNKKIKTIKNSNKLPKTKK